MAERAVGSIGKMSLARCGTRLCFFGREERLGAVWVKRRCVEVGGADAAAAGEGSGVIDLEVRRSGEEGGGADGRQLEEQLAGGSGRQLEEQLAGGPE